MASSERIRLVAGLGNPGQSYATTRHNAGFMVIDDMAMRYAIRVTKKRPDALIGKGCIEGVETVLAKPMAFMNRSGPPVHLLLEFFKVLTEDMLVVHDDMDLEFGRLQIKEKGGHGGHKGIKSLMDALGTGDFTRLRIGIGHPGPERDASSYVLENFHENEAQVLNQIMKRATDAVVTVLCKGAKEGMNEFNRKSQLQFST